MAKYKCKVCGYIHEGNKAPDVCPVCAAPASDFEEMKDEAAANQLAEEVIAAAKSTF